MNILSLVITILMIFAISTQMLLSKKVSSDIISKSYVGYMKVQRRATSKSETYYYSTIKTEKNEKEIKQKIKTEKVKKIKEPNRSESYFNIYPLITEGKESHPELYESILHLIRVLYLENGFFKNLKIKNLDKEILNNILLSAKESLKEELSANELHLAKLELKEKDLQPIYYKMMKGSKFYNYKEKIGYPSLLDFIKIRDEKNKIPINSAHFEILSILFNEKIAEEIVKLQLLGEEITKERLNDLLTKKHFQLNPKIWDFISFTNISNPTEIIVKDENTDISLKRAINL